MRRTSILLVVLIAVAAGGVALAQGFWAEKDFRKWSEKECRKMLEDSPWSRSFTHSRNYIESMGASTRDRNLQMVPRFDYVIQIRSALPVRQALVRQKQLEADYDQASPERRKELDQQADEFLSRESQEVIVVYVMYSVNVMTYFRELAKHWESMPPEVAMKQIQLFAPRGQKIYPLSYTKVGGAGGAFQLTFPKQINGEPILTTKDKELKLRFSHPDIAEQGEAQVSVNFDLRKMTVGGKILY